MRIYCADVETNGLYANKIWVMGICEVDPVTMKVMRSYEITGYEEIKEEISRDDTRWVIHNGCSYDVPTLLRILGVFNGVIVDSLGLSWYLEPKRNVHGLASYGEEFGVPKPEVEDWETQPIEVYIHRVAEDVKIQTKLWQRQWKHLMLLYKSAPEAWRAVEYITDKMKALAIAENSKWKLNVTEAESLVVLFDQKFQEAVDNLEPCLPQVPVYANKERPKKPFKMDGAMSATGLRWKLICEEHNIDFASKKYSGVLAFGTWKMPSGMMLPPSLCVTFTSQPGH